MPNLRAGRERMGAAEFTIIPPPQILSRGKLHKNAKIIFPNFVTLPIAIWLGWVYNKFVRLREAESPKPSGFFEN